MTVPPSQERMASVLSTIAVQARRTNQARVAALRAALQRATTDGLDADGWAAAERTAHQLAGSAGTFGYFTASDLARDLEAVLAGLAQNGLAQDGSGPNGSMPDGSVPDGSVPDGPGDSTRLTEALDLLDRLTAQLSTEPELD